MYLFFFKDCSYNKTVSLIIHICWSRTVLLFIIIIISDSLYARMYFDYTNLPQPLSYDISIILFQKVNVLVMRRMSQLG